MKALIICATLLLGVCIGIELTHPHGLPPKDANGVAGVWCSASIATDYAQTPPKQILVAPAGWCWPGEITGHSTAGGYTAQ